MVSNRWGAQAHKLRPWLFAVTIRCTGSAMPAFTMLSLIIWTPNAGDEMF
jgi:hypothetical protein